jgi:hypothetical protein
MDLKDYCCLIVRQAALIITSEIPILPWHVVGDVTSIRLPEWRPHPKAWSFAEAQLCRLARKIVAQLAGGETAGCSRIDACIVKLDYHESRGEGTKR